MKFGQRISNIIITPDNPFDPMDQLNRTIATAPQRLRSIAPTAIWRWRLRLGRRALRPCSA